MDTMRKLRELFDKTTQKKFIGLFGMMIVAALLETLGIGLIVPFVGIVTNPSSINDNAILSTIYNTLGFESTSAFLITATIVLLGVFVLKNAYLVLFNHLQFKVIFNEQVTTSKRLLNAYLKLPYTYHLEKNSSELVRNTNTEVQRVFRQVIVPSMLILTETVVVISVLCLLLVMAPIPTLISGVVLGGSVALFFRIFRKKLSSAAKSLQTAQGQMIKWVNQGLGAGKEVKVSGKEQFFVDAYTEQSTEFAEATRFHELMKKIPRFFIETIVVGAILLMVLIIMLQTSDLATLLSTISLFAMAAFRLMPSINRMTSAMTTVRQGKPALDVIHHDLIIEKVENKADEGEREERSMKDKAFETSIDANNVSFRYPNTTEDAIQNVSLSIPIGKSVAFVGPSGSGKTTMADIMLGVLYPHTGTITIDGDNIQDIRSLWQKNIGYIPQAIFLSDDSIRRNVAFGRYKEDIDDVEVWRALRQANLADFIQSLPNGIDTFVGERGVRLSGGQRQRIGIARALYHDPEILFLDEATSALDNDTEKEIMKAIDGLKGEKTLIIIAHRLTTIEKCDFVYKMEQGSASYQQTEKIVT
ncbi:ABC transporter ATP-binding protein [Salibacterium salarium]|nr:ABC transporter ATP-binding protein [Salibacterium salarium]